VIGRHDKIRVAGSEGTAVTIPVEERVRVDGATIRLLRGGAGPALVFLHGAGGFTGWLPFMAELASEFTVVVPEHPGFGVSDDPPWLDAVGDLAYFHLDLMAALGLDRVHLVGTSLGGWIAAEMAVRDSRRLASLTLVAAVGITAGGAPIDDIFRMPVDENLRRYYADQERAQRRLADLDRGDLAIAARNRAIVMRLAYRPRFHNPALANWLHRIAVPTLLVWGRQDRLVPPAFGEAYRALIPQSRLVVLDDAGHAPFDEQRAAFTAAFRCFVAERHPAAG
jgi:pimeloyl-ACP methyl ester carboxylesterase